MNRLARPLPSLAVFLLLLAAAARAADGPGATPGGPASPRVEEVIIAFKTHFDIGYTDMAASVVQRYRTTMIDQALDVVDASRSLPPDQQFVWTIPGWPLAKIAEDWPGQSPNRKARVQRAFGEGRFVVHALPFTTHTETLDLEDLVRGLGYSSRLARQAGLALPRDAKMTDVPCHSWAMVTLLRHAGVDFLHLGCNAASSSPRVPALFWWEGPDGSRLLTMYSAAGYGTGLVPPADWPYRAWLALIHTGDNHGPPTPNEVRQVLDEARRKLPGVRVRIGRLSDFADAILRQRADIPVVRGDMPDTWIHGPMCDPRGASLARTIRPAMAATEALHTHLRAWDVSAPDARAALASARENSLLYGEHTWGGALSWVTAYASGKVKFPYGEAFQAELAQGRFNRLEDSWAEHTSYIESAHAQTTQVLDAALRALAQAVGVDGPRIVVFNPLPWKRDGLVSVAWKQDAPAALAPADGGEPVPCALDGQTLRFVARNVPPLGYRTWVPAKRAPVLPPLQVDSQAAVMETPLFKATLDPARGCVRSLVDKRSGRELVDSSGPHGFGQYLYERFDADQVQAYVKAYVKIKADWAINELGKPPMPPAREVPYRAASPKNPTLRFEQAPWQIAAVMHAPAGQGLAHAVSTRVRLYRDLPWVDLEVTIHDKPKDSWPEACWLCLPWRVERARFQLARLGSIVDPARDLVPGANRDVLWLHGGLTATDPEGRGAGLCPLDHPMVSLERPGCWKYTPDFVPQKAAVYVNLFNNQWTTNFRMWNGGTWTSRVRVWAVERAEAATSLVTPSTEARCPLAAAAFDGAAGRLPASRAGLEVSRPGVVPTAFGPNPDGPGTLLRLWELAGVSGPCEVRLPEGVKAERVQPVNPRGQPAGSPIGVHDRAFRCALGRFAPASFVLLPSDTAAATGRAE